MPGARRLRRAARRGKGWGKRYRGAWCAGGVKDLRRALGVEEVQKEARNTVRLLDSCLDVIRGEGCVAEIEMLTWADCRGVNGDDGDENLANAPAGDDENGGPGDGGQ